MIDPALPEEAASVDARMLRQFAGLWLLLWSGLAYWQYSGGHPTRALVLGGLAAAFGPIGLARPESIRPLFSLLLGLAYYGLFTPLALFFRARGRDPLARRRRPDAKTYWTPRTGTHEPRRYLRQV
jgi:hypothetical protein